MWKHYIQQVTFFIIFIFMNYFSFHFHQFQLIINQLYKESFNQAIKNFMKVKKVKKNNYQQLSTQNASDMIAYYKKKFDKKQEQPSTSFNMVLIAIIILIVYYIIYKLMVIFIEIKIVNENTDFVRQNIQASTSASYEFGRKDFQQIEKNNPPQFQKFSKQKIRYQPIPNQEANYVNNQNLNYQTLNPLNSQTPGQLQIDPPILKQLITPQQLQKLQIQRLKQEKIQLLGKIKQNILEQERLKNSQNQVTSESINKMIDQDQKRNTLIRDNFEPSDNINNINNEAEPQKINTQQPKLYGKNHEDLSKFVDAPAKPLGFQVNRAGIQVGVIKQAVRFVELINKPKDDPLADEQRNYYEQKYHLSKFQKQIPICAVVPSFNNVQDNRYIGNIESILQQQYDNYHIVFIDDASSDNISEKLKQYLKPKNLPQGKIQFVRNQQQMFAMHNLRRAALQFCKPEQIYMIVDGDDRLLGRQVFRLYNAIFQQKKAYFVYTNFITTFGNLGYSRPFPATIKKDNRYRKYTYVTSHLRAYYTRLFQLVKDEDLRDNEGKYFRAANDVAICLPILQMSQEKVQYVPQITYYYNGVTGLNNHKIRLDEQKKNNKIVRKRSKYFPVPNLFGESGKQIKTITN